MTRTLASFLADRPETELTEMLAGVQEARQRLREEEQRLAVEEGLLKDALSRRSRRTSNGGGSGSARLTREQVLRILAQHGKPVTIAEATDLVTRVHPASSRPSVRNHMHRLRDQNKLVHSGNQYFVNPGVALAMDPILTDQEPVRTDEAFPPAAASFPAGTAAEQTSPNPTATGPGENREMSLTSGSQDGPG